MQHPHTPLNETGLRQADAVAERLHQLGFARILSSDMARARMTAEAISLRSGIAVEESVLLHERNFGDLRGMSYDDLTEDPFGPDYTPPNGESWTTFHARVDAAFAWMVSAAVRPEGVGGPGEYRSEAEERSPSVSAAVGVTTLGNVVVVTHGLVCRSIVDRLVGLGPENLVTEGFGNTSVTILDVQPPHRLRLLNCITHLHGLDGVGPAASGGGIA